MHRQRDSLTQCNAAVVHRTGDEGEKNYCDLLSLDTKLVRLLPNPNELVAISKGSKTLLRQNPPVLD